MGLASQGSPQAQHTVHKARWLGRVESPHIREARPISGGRGSHVTHLLRRVSHTCLQSGDSEGVKGPPERGLQPPEDEDDVHAGLHVIYVSTAPG